MRVARLVSIGFGAGLMRPAPGTWGSAAAIAVGLVIDRYLGAPMLVIAALAATAAGLWACHAELKDSPGLDPSEIVIDEIAGQWIALAFPALAFWWRGWDDWMPYPGWVAAFLFFRLFDIWKPWFIGRADKRHDWLGVMLDDLFAGLCAGLAVIVAAGLAHGYLM
ncbi:phosphatidylglycerophosphatase A family protein [Pararhodobacter marinus]|uniref:Phosphatidylglycerophosphatase A n=1 Tax=Pararhodobacter marinus TaxID=2184063 RepID=A0A2U2CGJ3_9RHOB|nr:phosphatidylglycerophosphatase A [Pararhodobacter marinus]PWE31008.1 phosphatidylglycerophosphatase A [Pararhodobacter marinus]